MAQLIRPIRTVALQGDCTQHGKIAPMKVTADGVQQISARLGGRRQELSFTLVNDGQRRGVYRITSLSIWYGDISRITGIKWIFQI